MFWWILIGIIGLLVLLFVLALVSSLYLSSLSYDELLQMTSKHARTER